MKKLLCMILAFLVALNPIPVLAWSEGGHHIISLLAFDLLTKEEQAKLLDILTKHPRYTDDFIAPKGLPNEEEVVRWKVGHIGYWPDVARKQPQYHRSTWHYELGASLVIGNEAKLNVPPYPGRLPDGATLETQDLYIAQAIELCINTLNDKSSNPIDRALSLCWIGHLVADAHQPCHAGSLYAEGIFTEKDGDRGANRIFTKQRGNMHALWDNLLGDEFSLNGTRKRIVEITGDEDLVTQAKKSVSGSDGLNPQTWLSESRSAAKQFVYTNAVLAHLKSGEGTKKENAISIDERELKNDGRIAQQRALEAAYRLAAIWKMSL